MVVIRKKEYLDGWELVAVGDGSKCPMMEFFKDNGSTHKLALMRMFQQIASGDLDPQKLPITISKNIEKRPGLREFIQGDIRVLWFYCEGVRKRIVCTHGFIKHFQIPPESELQRAEKLKKCYLQELSQVNTTQNVVKPKFSVISGSKK